MTTHDDEIQNDPLGEQIDLDCIDRLGAALTHVPDVASKHASDPVSHPAHYTSDPSGIECIQITRHRNFAIGSAIKYLWRAGLKQDADKTAQDKQIQDLEKACWYIQDEIQRLKEQS